MLDILVALVEELMGKKKAPPPQPRRRVRSADSSAADERPVQRADAQTGWFDQPTAPVGQANPPEFEAMVRQFFGMEEEEPEPVRPVPAPQPAPPAPVPHVATVRPVEPARTPLLGSLGVIDETEPLLEVATKADAASSRSLRDMALGLRNNPNAAREGFLYSEIFGPPLADRY